MVCISMRSSSLFESLRYERTTDLVFSVLLCLEPVKGLGNKAQGCQIYGQKNNGLSVKAWRKY